MMRLLLLVIPTHHSEARSDAWRLSWSLKTCWKRMQSLSLRVGSASDTVAAAAVAVASVSVAAEVE